MTWTENDDGFDTFHTEIADAEKEDSRRENDLGCLCGAAGWRGD
jgi:hypothetical protein